MAKKKSNFYHVRWNRVGLNEARTANVGVEGWNGFWTPRMLILYHEKNAEIDRLHGENRQLKSWAGLKLLSYWATYLLAQLFWVIRFVGYLVECPRAIDRKGANLQSGFLRCVDLG